MKHRIIMIVAGVLCVMITLGFLIPASDIGRRYIQHADAAVPQTPDTSDGFSTHLPLVSVDTGGEIIPGAGKFRDGRLEQIILTEDGRDEIQASLSIVDNEGGWNHPSDEPAVQSDIIIHVRGNSSREFEKPSYAIRLITPEGENNPCEVMGMTAHHEWILYGPYLDETLIRNYMWYNIAGEIMDWAPNVRFCELMLNGEYRGVYVMTETITAGDNCRLPLSVNAKNRTYSGYLLRLDRGSDTEIKNLTHFTGYALRTRQIMNIVYPGTSNLTEELARDISLDFSSFEKMLYSFDFDNDTGGYRDYIDVDSFVDYFIINEATCNYDAGWLSTYIYKSTDGKFRTCIWDFNSACDNYQYTMVASDDFRMDNCIWFYMLIKDNYFTDRIIERYRELRQTYLSDEYLNSFIDDTIAYLGDAVDRNYEVWGHLFDEGYDLLFPADRNADSFEEAVDKYRTFINDRLGWLDENIESVSQYSAESRMKKFDEEPS